MIEIRELVIRATVDDSPRRNGESRRDANPERNEQKGCCAETVDALLQIINDKKER